MTKCMHFLDLLIIFADNGRPAPLATPRGGESPWLRPWCREGWFPWGAAPGGEGL